MFHQYLIFGFLTFGGQIYDSYEHPVTNYANALSVIWLKTGTHPVAIVVDSAGKFVGALPPDSLHAPAQNPTTSRPTVVEVVPKAASGSNPPSPTKNNSEAHISSKDAILPKEPAVHQGNANMPNAEVHKGLAITLTGKTVEITSWAGDKTAGQAAIDSAAPNTSVLPHEQIAAAVNNTTEIVSTVKADVVGPKAVKEPSVAATTNTIVAPVVNVTEAPTKAPETTAAQTTTVATTEAATTVTIPVEAGEPLEYGEDYTTTMKAPMGMMGADPGEPLEAP